jgi:glycosyltransferase involved in cell wall biosynthesis
VDNGSIDGTADYLRTSLDSAPPTIKISLVINENNEVLSKPTNEFWQNSGADLVGKIDNDILVEDGWLEKLATAHQKVSKLAAIGGFHFPMKIFDYKKCKHNIYEYNNIQILRQPHIGGNYLAKRHILLENGFLEDSGAADFKLGGWTGYQNRLTKKGYIIGYHYPLICFEHLHLAPSRYYKKVRKMSKRKYLRWERKDGEEMIYTKWSWD